MGHCRQAGGAADTCRKNQATLLATRLANDSGGWGLTCVLVGPVGLEPTTYGLKVRSSAN